VQRVGVRGSVFPYGVVMATGVSAQLAAVSDNRWLVRCSDPLLALAGVQAVVIAALGTRAAGWKWSWPSRPSRPSPRALADRASVGWLTIPIGMDVVGAGLGGLGGRLAATGAAAAVGGAAVLTLVLAAEGAGRRGELSLVGIDGRWFLVPAVFLADAIGTVAVATRFPVSVPALRAVAMAWGGLGVIAYVAVLVLVAVRVTVAWLDGALPAAWWIAAGCGGLAAAAVGHVAVLFARSSVVVSVASWSALVLWGVGTALLVPIVAGGVARLFRERRYRGRLGWPPTFSTGVYALGSLQVARLRASSVVLQLGHDAGIATVALWAGTTVLWLYDAVLTDQRPERGIPGAGAW